jgi:6-phosphogluconolactonase
VYAVNENGDKSEVSSFTYDKQSGKLELLNQVSSNGADPCHIINDEKNVLTANYSGGTITILNKKYNGSLSDDSHVVRNEVHEKNEEKPRTCHVHMLQFSPDKKYLISSDLGSDYLHVFNYNGQSGTNPLSFKSSFRVKKGAGPRHFTFSPNGKFVYLLNELDGSLIAFKYNDGNLKLLQKTTVVERHFKGKISAAEIIISADGKFLYATNRGDANTISCFEIKENGKLKLLQTTSTLGKGPRNFTIDPSGNFLLIGHQYTNNIVVFKIDKATGLLTDSVKRLDLCSPVCLVFE